MKSFLKNTAAVVGSVVLGLAVAAGLCAIGCPALLAGIAGTAVYVERLLANVSE
jgi:hypothetical protein